MKVREPRQRLALTSRLRCGATWTDACIVNISRRGLGLQSVAPPVPGSYVEICRGDITVIACVVWVEGQRFGARTQDNVSATALVDARRDVSEVGHSNRMSFEKTLPRRATSAVHESSRASGRIIEFCFVGILAVAAASAAAATLTSAVGHPISAVEAAMSR